MSTPNLSLAYLVASQSQKEVTHNDALNDLDGIVQASALSRALATPPASPAQGDVYLVAASPTGAWAGQAGTLASYYSGWRFKTPEAGWRVWLRDEARLVYFTGSAWALLALPLLDGVLTWTPGTLAAGAGVSSSAVTVSGAALGDFARVAAPYDLQGVGASAYVNAAGSAVIRLQNLTGAAVTLAAGTWRVRVMKA